VFDAQLFDDLFANLVDNNAEGTLASSGQNRRTPGLPFTASEVERVRTQPLQATGAAAVRLAHNYSRMIISG
jgi:hypothetical protein